MNCNKITGKVKYLEFLEQVMNLGNKDHNPFRQLLQRLEIFVHENKIDASTMLKQIGAKTSDGVSVNDFANFLKQKVEKVRDINQLKKMAE